MTTAAQHHEDHHSLAHLSHQRQPPQIIVDSSTYDPDEVVPRNSPLMRPLRLRLEPSPSPPPDIPLAQVSFSPFPTDNHSRSNRPKIYPISGDSVILKYLGNGSHPEVAAAAAAEALPPDEDDSEFDGDDGDVSSSMGSPPPLNSPQPPSGLQKSQHPAALTGGNLRQLASTALQRFAATPAPAPGRPIQLSPDISASAGQLSLRDGRSRSPIPQMPPVAYLTKEPYPPRTSLERNVSAASPIALLTPNSGELPPLQMDSPRSELNGQSLPSIQQTFGDLDRLTTESHVKYDEPSPLANHPSSFARSPPATGAPRLHHMTSSHVSPPISPNDLYQRGLPSPRPTPGGSSYYCSPGSTSHPQNNDHGGGSIVETPSTEHSAPTPSVSTATSGSVVERMSIDGITNQQVGAYRCTVPGCTAPPFQTQYLLNSHANVHSSVRPHYCPVAGCSRSEGGRGFKRKNEMIRHGLVHDSPGYVCPFCPDREHKYPRPDNLQRHVRVHHMDKSKDDPLLRDVLSQRPDGPNRGRRRRGAGS
jgi:hypothetical protein